MTLGAALRLHPRRRRESLLAGRAEIPSVLQPRDQAVAGVRLGLPVGGLLPGRHLRLGLLAADHAPELPAVAGRAAQADGILAAWSNLEQESGRTFLTEKLGELARRRSDLEGDLVQVSQALAQIEDERVTAETVRASLTRFRDVFAHLMPGERKELMRLMLHRAEVGDRQIVLEIYPIAAPEMEMPQSRSRSEAPSWLPGQDSNLQPSG